MPLNEYAYVLVGPQVALGTMRTDLIPVYLVWKNDIELQRALSGAKGMYTLEAYTEYYQRQLAVEDTLWLTIYVRASETPVGTVKLSDICYQNRTARFSIVLAHADARQRGYATEACELMLDYAFRDLQLYSLYVQVPQYNIAAFKTFEKVGFVQFGREREAVIAMGRVWDKLHMQCLAPEFFNKSEVGGRNTPAATVRVR